MGHGCGQIDHQLFLAHLRQQFGLVLHQQNLAFVDHAHTVGNRLGLFDVMRGQDDGHPFAAQIGHNRPHILAQFDIDTGGGFVQKQHAGFVG